VTHVAGSEQRGLNRRYATVLGWAALAFWAAFFEQLLRSGTTARNRENSLADLYHRYLDSHLVLHHAALLYAPRKFAFTYPPVVAYLFVPFHAIGWPATAAVWTVLSVVSLAVILFAVCSRYFPVPPGVRWLLITAALVPAATLLCTPVQSCLESGQFGLILLALTVVDALLLPERWRGILIGLAAGIKILPAAFLVWFLIRGERAAALRLVATAAGVTLLGYLLSPSLSNQFFFHVLLTGRDVTTEGQGKVGDVTNQSLRGLLTRSPFSLHSDAVWLVLALVLTVVSVVAIRWLLHQGRELTAFTMVAAVSALVWPVTWFHYWVFIVLFPAVAILEYSRSLFVTGGTVLAFALCAIDPLARLYLRLRFHASHAWVQSIVDNCFVLGGSIFVGCCIASAWHLARLGGVRRTAA